MELEDFFNKIPKRNNLSSGQLIPYFMYFLHKDMEFISAGQIQKCFEQLKLKAYSNISGWLVNNSKGKNAKVIKGKNGYTLNRNSLNSISFELENKVTDKVKPDEVCAIDTFKNKIQRFIDQGVDIKEKEYSEFAGKFKATGECYSQWMIEINLFSQKYLKGHPLYSDMQRTYFHRNAIGSYEDMMGYLRTLLNDTNFDDTIELHNDKCEVNELEEVCGMTSNKVFIVHGHDDLAKEQVARIVEKAGFEAIILHEKASGGRTIIEKIEKYSDVSYAIVLYTTCDVGYDKNIKEEHSRARQNVVFEHGYLIGKLGREHVCALVKEKVETPGDISGVVYVPMDDGGAWKMALAKEMDLAGLQIDYSKFA